MSSKADTIRLVPDLRSWELFPEKNNRPAVYLVGSLQLDKYLAVPAEHHPLVMQIFEKLRLGWAPEQIEAELEAQGVVVNVREFCQMLACKNVIEWEAKAGESSHDESPGTRWGSLLGHLRALSWQVFSLNLDRCRSILERVALPMLVALIAAALLTGVMVGLQATTSTATLRQMAGDVFTDRRVIWITLANLLIFPFFVVLHESAHAVAAARGQVYPRRLSLRMYLLSVPYFSLQLPGLYTLPIGKRLLAIAAGPLMDLTLGNLFLLAARSADGVWVSWLALMALSNYSRLVFNILPILPMTDGHAFLSQAVFREIDIRGRASKEFRRWWQEKSNNFEGKYIAFFVLNVGVAAFVIIGALLQVNAMALRWLRAARVVPANELTWWMVGGLIALDGLCLFIARNRLRVLLGL